MTRRLTVAQALVRFLAAQYSERDGVEQRLIAGCFGIFGHGNVAGIGQALLEAEVEDPEALPYVLARNEQAMVHAPSATPACATASRPGRARARSARARPTWSPARRWPRSTACRSCCCRATSSPPASPSPVLQELEDPGSYDVSVNDCFRPVSPLLGPHQPAGAARVEPAGGHARAHRPGGDRRGLRLASPRTSRPRRSTGRRSSSRAACGTSAAPCPSPSRWPRAAELLRGARRPLIVAGGGTIYAEATGALRAFAEQTGIPVAETQAGKGSLPYDHPQRGRRDRRDGDHGRQRAGPRGRRGARHRHALERLHDGLAHGLRRPGRRASSTSTSPPSTPPSTPGSRSWPTPAAAWRRSAMRWPAGARTTSTAARARRLAAEWDATVEARLHARARPAPGPVGGHRRRQPRSRTRATSCLRGGQHARRPAQAVAHPRPEGLPRRVRLLVHGLRDRRRPGREARRARPRGGRHGRRRLLPDDGPGDRHRRAGAREAHRSCSSRTTASRRSARSRRRVGSQRFGTRYRYRDPQSGSLDGDLLPVDLAANAASLGARRAHRDHDRGVRGRVRARRARRARTTVVHVQTDPLVAAPDSDAWWDVPVAAVAELDSTRAARAAYEGDKRGQQAYLGPRQKVTP